MWCVASWLLVHKDWETIYHRLLLCRVPLVLEHYKYVLQLLSVTWNRSCSLLLEAYGSGSGGGSPAGCCPCFNKSFDEDIYEENERQAAKNETAKEQGKVVAVQDEQPKSGPEIAMVASTKPSLWIPHTNDTFIILLQWYITPFNHTFIFMASIWAKLGR